MEIVVDNWICFGCAEIRSVYLSYVRKKNLTYVILKPNLNANLKQNLNYLKPKLNTVLNLNLYYAQNLTLILCYA